MTGLNESKCPFDGKRIMTIKLNEILNNHYINIVQKLSGEKSVCCTLKLSQMLNC